MTRLLTSGTVLLLIFLSANTCVFAQREYYEIRTYRFKNPQQQTRTEKFIKEAFVPAAHRFGISQVGVFKPVENDSTSGKRLYILIPYSSADKPASLTSALLKDTQYLAAGKDYLEASYDAPPYERMEVTFLLAFEGMPKSNVPKLAAPPGERIYELRSYESATEKLYKNKVKMFNQGNEISLFERLGFNAVFYGEVLSGSHMPNLMYMTSFDNQASRDEHWKAFVNSPEWKALISMPEYKNNMSHIDIFLLHSTDYSDF